MLAAYLRPIHDISLCRTVAAALISRFGSLPAVAAAPSKQLQEVEHVSAKTVFHLQLLRSLTIWMASNNVALDQPVLSSWTQLLDYLRTQMAYNATEQLRILFLDKKNRLIADEVQQTGTIDQASLYPREVIKRALELSATAMIFVHNHPSGDPSPSSADVRMTRDIGDAGRQLGITLHDHLIIGRAGHMSMRAHKLM
jgi:DNA repair protein RadC